MSVDYAPSRNRHTLTGARAALSVLLDALPRPQSLVDVGCGPGTWLREALDAGVSDVAGVEGAVFPPGELHVDESLITKADLTAPFNLGRRFDLALCLEVAEHLPAAAAPILLDSLVLHSDVVAFSAACPGQGGQHHVHCQWPAYWQEEFNRRGYVCSDAIRWRLWDDDRIEPWYRQNLFIASKDILGAGRESRLPGVVHPEMVKVMLEGAQSRTRRLVDSGELGVAVSARSLYAALRRKTNRQ